MIFIEVAGMAVYTALEKEEERHGEGRGSRDRVLVWLWLPGHTGTLCSSALRLDGQGNPGVNESSLHGSFHPGIKKGCSEPRSMSRGVTADRQPPQRRNTNPGSCQNIPPRGKRPPHTEEHRQIAERRVLSPLHGG